LRSFQSVIHSPARRLSGSPQPRHRFSLAISKPPNFSRLWARLTKGFDQRRYISPGPESALPDFVLPPVAIATEANREKIVWSLTHARPASEADVRYLDPCCIAAYRTDAAADEIAVRLRLPPAVALRLLGDGAG